ncbi:MAG: TetR/AcrR family transcriptional regulator [Vicinamibacterales bacterium]
MNLDSSTDQKVSLRIKFRTATREAILEAAADLLGSDGGVQTRMEDIAARAGVAVGTVYNYFEDRKALVSVLLESRTRSLLEELDGGGHPGAKSPGTSGDAAHVFHTELTHFVGALSRHVESNRFLFNVLQDEVGQRGLDAKAATRKQTLLDELLERAERIMEKGMKSKVLKKGDPALYAAIFVGMMRGVALSSLTTRQPLAVRAGDLVDLFLRGAAR